jgi:hypothetical protein
MNMDMIGAVFVLGVLLNPFLWLTGLRWLVVAGRRAITDSRRSLAASPLDSADHDRAMADLAASS